MGRLTPAASAAHALLKMFRVPGALHRNLGDGALDLADILGAERHVGGADVLRETLELGGAGDRNDPWFAGKKPGQRDLRRGGLSGFRQLLEEIDQGLVRLARRRREARNDIAEVGAVERGRLVDRPGEKAL